MTRLPASGLGNDMIIMPQAPGLGKAARPQALGSGILTQAL